ncbi:MAG: hypothetical protein QOF51_3092 [Chloroflexota bacterium]|jgi:hypothetical protein|nr:hypothetical protein [Chloroflexota bacterium]
MFTIKSLRVLGRIVLVQLVLSVVVVSTFWTMAQADASSASQSPVAAVHADASSSSLGSH